MNVPTGTELDASRAKAQADHLNLRSRISRLSDDSIDLILRDARSHYAWTDKPIPDGMLIVLFILIEFPILSLALL
jgi:3-hydroxypropanoate dehydrogenase